VITKAEAENELSSITSRILFLRSNPIAPDPRVEKAAATLSKLGYGVAVLGWDRMATLPVHADQNGILFHRLPIQAEYGTGIRNLPALLRWQWGELKWLVRHREDFDLLHACDFDTVIPALLMKLLWKKKVVYDIFDFYADHLRSTPDWIIKIISYMDKKCINWADGIILVDDARKAQIAGAHPKRCAVIYNTPTDDILNPQSEDDEVVKHSFRLAYVGLLQVERGIFEILEVMKRHPEWSLDLAGFGGDEELIKTQAQSLENVNWHARIPYDHALRLSRNAHVLFATYDPAIPNHRYASPNKVFEAMMLGVPIIVARDTNIDSIIQKFDCGLVVDYGDITGLEDALITLCEDSALRNRLGEGARRAYESTYNWTEMAARLQSMYASILN
jgi:glycosyltransferase involved in cell wall biosynthesis